MCVLSSSFFFQLLAIMQEITASSPDQIDKSFSIKVKHGQTVQYFVEPNKKVRIITNYDLWIPNHSNYITRFTRYHTYKDDYKNSKCLICGKLGVDCFQTSHYTVYYTSAIPDYPSHVFHYSCIVNCEYLPYDQSIECIKYYDNGYQTHEITKFVIYKYIPEIMPYQHLGVNLNLIIVQDIEAVNKYMNYWLLERYRYQLSMQELRIWSAKIYNAIACFRTCVLKNPFDSVTGKCSPGRWTRKAKYLHHV